MVNVYFSQSPPKGVLPCIVVHYEEGEHIGTQVKMVYKVYHYSTSNGPDQVDTIIGWAHDNIDPLVAHERIIEYVRKEYKK